MKEIRKYVADDGKEFENYFDCKNYEQVMQYNRLAGLLGNDLQFYDNRKNLTTNYERAEYIIARTEAAKDAIDNLAMELSTVTPWDDCPSARDDNAWYWEEDYDEWRTYGQLKNHQEALTEILTALDFWLNKQGMEEK